MFSYYGSKSKIIGKYPKPIYNTIIEPFAGAGWYSVKHASNKVCLNEKNKTVYGIWDWLINEATEIDILAFTDFYVGQNISKLSADPRHIDLIGFCVNRGSVQPKNIVQKWSCQSNSNPEWASTVSFSLKRIARLLPSIKHWTVTNLDYTEIANLECTWFIDAPYEFGGEHYPTNDIDFKQLSEWCLSRRGQVIVCENTKATWFPFSPLVEITGQRVKTMEAIYTNSL